jgi:glycosyltransferase involved in cell wall biosynthesis
MFEVLRRLAGRHDVSVIGFWRSEEARLGWQQLGRQLDIKVQAVPFARLRPDRRLPGLLRRRWQGWRRGEPDDVGAWDQPAMHAALRQTMAGQRFDLLQVEWPYLAPYALANPQLPRLLVTHDIFSVALSRRAGLAAGRKRKRLQREAAAWAGYESRVYPQFQAVAAMSSEDAAVIQQRAPAASVVVLPNGVDTAHFLPGEIRPQPRNLIFVGSPTHAPNLDAACWLLSEIWPELRRRRPDLRLTLVNLDHPQVRKLQQPGVEISGRLPDLRSVYQQADIAIVPLRAGSGTRLKILEAFAAGLPVVSTPLGHEGLEVIPGRHLLSAAGGPAFVQAIEALLDDAELRRNLAATARGLVVSHYDWEIILDQHDTIYRQLCHRQ